MYCGSNDDGTGVFEIYPKTAAYEFSEQILLGTISYNY